MEDRIILITKDAMCRSYLPVYGNKYWNGKTPNIDALASKGTVFTNYYTVAPSTAMSFLGMFTEKYPYQLDIQDYSPLKKQFKDTAFRKLSKLGYRCHIIWDKAWECDAFTYSNCYGGTTLHSLEHLYQPVGPQFKHENIISEDAEKTAVVLQKIEKEIVSISDAKFFLWIHLPHVINGRISFGGDIDVFDKIIGIARKYFEDTAVYISSDHGNMNGSHGRVCYGFDVYDQAIRIPLISPRFEGLSIYNNQFSAVDLIDFIIQGKPRVRDFVYSDSAYYKQPHRKLALIHKEKVYIYNKENDYEEAYDLSFDSEEGINLINEMYYDRDRHTVYPLRELITYNGWDEMKDFVDRARIEKQKIWRS